MEMLLFDWDFRSLDWLSFNCPSGIFGDFRQTAFGLAVFSGIHGEDEFSDGREIGFGAAAFDAVQRFRPYARTAGKFGLGKTSGTATSPEFFGQRYAIDIESRREIFFFILRSRFCKSRLAAQLIEDRFPEYDVSNAIEFDMLAIHQTSVIHIDLLKMQVCFVIGFHCVSTHFI
jgi:hypothetical protein